MTPFNQEKPIEPSEIASVGFSNSSKPLFPDSFFSQTDGEKFIVFFLNEKLYAMATKDVAEVTQMLPVAFLPNAPEWIFGIANLRGEIVTILNMPHILSRQSGEVSGKSKFVILQSKTSNSPIAFAVDKIGEIITLPKDKIESVEENSKPHVFGKTAHKLGVLHFIDAEEMLDSLVF